MYLLPTNASVQSVSVATIFADFSSLSVNLIKFMFRVSDDLNDTLMVEGNSMKAKGKSRRQVVRLMRCSQCGSKPGRLEPHLAYVLGKLFPAQ